MDLISHRLMGTEADKATVVPLLLAGNEGGSLPPLLRTRVRADFRDETAYFVTAFDLIVGLYGIAFDHPAVAEWRRSLRGEAWFLHEESDESLPDKGAEDPEFSSDNLR